MANTDVFERYFLIADTDHDGRISGQEAVAFFRGSGLPQVTLAKVWQFADHRQAGFLLKPDFFNALKLVTVAQTGRELTPEVVRAALTGPAASQIPAPQVNPQGSPAPQAGQPQQPRNLPSPPAPGYGAQVPGPRGPPAPGPAGMFAPQFPPQQGFSTGQFQAPGMPPGAMPPGQVPPGQNAPPSRTASQAFGAQGSGMLPSQGPYPPAPNQQQPRQPSSQSQGPPSQNLSAPNLGASMPRGPPQPQTSLLPALAAPAPTADPKPAPQKPQQQGFADFGAFSFSTQSTGPGNSVPAPGLAPAPASAPAPGTAKPPSSAGGMAALQGPLSAGKGALPEDLFGGDPFTSLGAPATSAAAPQSLPATPAVSESFLFASQVSGPPPAAPQQPPAGALAAPQQQVLAGPPKASPPDSFDPRRTAGINAGPPPAASGPQPGSVQGPGSIVQQQADGSPGSAPAGQQWPKMTIQDAQRYTGIFAQVDVDRDHKITGMEARNLFLGFGLPREILKKIWDLSDQDKDGMLSHREFCTAMYLIERFREGRPMPAVLPPGIHMDDSAGAPAPSQPQPMSREDIAAARMAEAQAAIAQNNKPAPWRLDPSMLSSASSTQQPQQPSRQQGPMQTAVGQMPVSAADASAVSTGPLAYHSKAPVLELSKVRQLAKEEQEAVQKRHKEAEEADKKVWTTEAELLDSKQKIDFYRTKMQEIIMFKSRCDNRLNEITERAAAEKREVTDLAKKYDEKYKQTEGVANRLMQEEAGLKDLQEKKAELHKAVTRLMEGGPTNGFLQEKADKLAAELEDLRKLVNKRAKQLGLTVRPIMGSDEVPFGWQPGLQENAVEWDDEWHEFDDEGFATVEDIGDNVGPVAIAFDDDDPFASSSNAPLALVKDEVPAAKENGMAVDEGATSKFGDDFAEIKETHGPEGQTGKEHDAEAKGVDKGYGEKEYEERDSRKSTTFDTEGERRGEYAGHRDDYVDSDNESHPEQYGDKDRESSLTPTKRTERYAGLADSQDFGGPGVFDQEHSYSSGNSTSFTAQAESSAVDTFGDGGPLWRSSFDQRLPNDDEADSGVRASWGLQSNPPSTQVSTDFGRDSTTFNRGFVDFGDSSKFDAGHKEEREEEVGNGKAKKEPEEEVEEEDNDPFTALFKKRAASYTSVMNWGDKPVHSSSTFDRVAFDSFNDDRGGVTTRDDDVADNDKQHESSVKASQSWSAF